MLRATKTRKLALGLVLAVLAASVPPLRTAVLGQLGVSELLPRVTADGPMAVRSS